MPWNEADREKYAVIRARYSSDMSDAEFSLISSLLPPPKRRGRKPTDARKILDALFYLIRSGCPWRLLPRDFPPFTTVQNRFYAWRDSGLWAQIVCLLVMDAREAEGCEASPSAVVIDSQSVKTTEAGGPRGFDAAKKIKGRKRQLAVDTLGLPIDCLITTADVQDRDALAPLLREVHRKSPFVKRAFIDGGYAGDDAQRAAFAASRIAITVVNRDVGLTLERVGLEACSLTAWLHDGLTQAGLPAICIETRQANAAMKTMPNKTDRNDARALAQIMRTGWFRQVHVKSRQCRQWRSLLIARRTIINEMRSIENVVRAILREGGVKLGTPSRADFVERVRELAGGDSEVTPLVEPLLAILGTMLREFARLTKLVLNTARKEEVCRRLMSVPGVGPITALAFRATIDRPARFRHSRDVGAHLGLTPARYQSGQTDIQGRISRCGDELARTALYEAAHTLLTRSRKWSSLRAWGVKIAKHRGMARARVAVARKLAVILHRMWTDGAEFRFGRQPGAVAIVLAA